VAGTVRPREKSVKKTNLGQEASRTLRMVSLHWNFQLQAQENGSKGYQARSFFNFWPCELTPNPPQ